VISTVAGGVGGPAKATQVMVQPCGAAFGAGHLYLTDFAAVRAVSLDSGWLTTPAGTGSTLGPLQNGGVATRSTLNSVCGVSVDPSGNLVLPAANRIWVVAASTGGFYGTSMTAGHIYTVPVSRRWGSAAMVARRGMPGSSSPPTRRWTARATS
jgi:hypothetical protein